MFDLGILCLFHAFFDLLQSDSDRLINDIHIGSCGLHGASGIGVTNDAPCGIDDLFDEVHELVALGLRFTRLARWRFHLAEDVFKVAHIGKEHVAHRTANFALWSRVFGPQVVAHQLPRLRVFRFEREFGSHILLLFRLCDRVFKDDLLAVAVDAENGTRLRDAEVI